MQLPNVRSPKLEIDLPVLNKFLFCLPLRPGILACGYLQLVTVVLISGSAIAKFAQEVPYRNGYQLVQIIILFMLIMIWNLLDAIFAVFQIIGAQKKLANFLEVVYHYLRAKVLLFAGFLIVSVFMKEFVVSDSWYYYNLDPWFNYCLMDNLAMGALAWIANFYLLLLVRSELIKLEHPIDFSTLYQRLYTSSELPEMSQDTKPAADAC